MKSQLMFLFWLVPERRVYQHWSLWSQTRNAPSSTNSGRSSRSRLSLRLRSVRRNSRRWRACPSPTRTPSASPQSEYSNNIPSASPQSEYCTQLNIPSARPQSEYSKNIPSTSPQSEYSKKYTQYKPPTRALKKIYQVQTPKMSTKKK